MKQVLIFSENEELVKSWTATLSPSYQVAITDDIYTHSNSADTIIIDSKKIENDKKLLSLFDNLAIRFLVVGSNWSEDDQINVLTHGAAGYCEVSESPKLILQALEQIIKGDIWIPRLLVPKVIGSLIKMKATADKVPSSKSIKLFELLSNREKDVAKLIQSGTNNKTIASALQISERTVKAHLTSIFKKLNIPSRLHLAVFIKELG